MDRWSKNRLKCRRTTINEDELKEFEIQSQCFGFSKPEVFGADHDVDNCLSFDHDIPDDQSSANSNTKKRLNL
ncbi:hypothetical protein ATANTOWER_031685 [Ataeniobius toweri]|uniref:Uncharacterized protein n=1 Tax=Ataeniobius toweri TaxID=208326 RepID=A0ABU7CDX9_9TELE|nr:hypothetical protein [Ataeniobius toweri]